MARLEPLRREDLPQYEDDFALTESVMGFLPNSLLTMARVPGLVEGFRGLAASVFLSELIPPAMVQMIAFVSSAGSGCRYCQAHTSKSVAANGIDEAKVAALWEFETSEHFDDAERAALRLAFHSGQVPNAATQADFDACREHWSDDQVAAIVAACALFGYLNRWNDTMATDLEDAPNTFAERVIAPGGWEPGNHR